MARKIGMPSVLRRMGEREAILVDVLDPRSYKKVHIKGAINVPFEDLEDRIRDEVAPDRPVITYSNDYECPISRMAAEKLEEMGYRKVYYYEGGKKEWLEAEMPLEKNN